MDSYYSGPPPFGGYPGNAGDISTSHFMPGFGGFRGADQGINDAANTIMPGWGGHRSDRDQRVLPDANSSVVSELMIDPQDYCLHDINQGELVFVVREGEYMKDSANFGVGKPAQRVFGLARLNEWLRTSREGRRLGTFRDAAELLRVVALKGIMVSAVDNSPIMTGRGDLKSVTVWVGGRAVTADIAAYSRGGNRDGIGSTNVTMPNDGLSICLVRIAPKNPMLDDDVNHSFLATPFPYWQAVPQRHATAFPAPLLYRSIPHNAGTDDEFTGRFLPVGFVRQVLRNEQVTNHDVADLCYKYCFCKKPNSSEHINAFNSLPQIELYMNLSTLQE